MSKSKLTDVLTDPEIKSHTERILALQEEERQTKMKLGSVIAAIGAELMAVKEALDKLSDKTAWLRWLKTHVHYSAKTAQNYMAVARLGEKTKALSFFVTLEPTVLYRIAALPDDIVATLTPDTLLTDPRTGRQTALREMSTRTLDRSLDALEGKTAPQKPKPVSTDVVLSGQTREAFAADAQRIMGQLSSRLTEIRGRKGSLTGTSKQRVLEAIENLRRIVLKWPAWASPAADKTGLNG
ncbi:MAG: DUF3102 domain-containing protein [Planctomycetota bacterium]